MASIISPLSIQNKISPEISPEVIVTQQNTIVALQEQINNIRSEVGIINSGLQNVSKLLQDDSLSERLRLLEEQKKEKELSDSQTRIGKEEEVERNLDSAISKPIENLEPKLSSTLNNVSNSLKLLFFGFLTKGVIEGIKNTANFVIKGFSNIKSFITKTLGVINDTFSWMKRGFTGIANSIGNVINKVKGVISTLIKSPFKFISDLFKKAQGKIGNSGASAVKSVESSSGGLLDDILRSIGKASKGVSKIVSPALGGGLTYFMDTAMGESPGKAAAGAVGAVVGGGIGATLGAPFGPIGSFAGSVGLGMLGQDVAKKGFDFVTGVGKNIEKKSEVSTTQQSPILPITSSKNTNTDSTQQSPILDSRNFLSNYNLNLSGTNSEMNIKPVTENVKLDEKSKIPNSNIELNEKPKTPNFQPEIQSPPKNNQKIGSLPEPKPNVIMASSVKQNPNKNRQMPKSNAGTDVPLISSSNSDNFYSLYSQTNYNVVM
jgi:uncharacterized protein YcfJ